MKKFLLFLVLGFLFAGTVFGAVEVIESSGVWEGDRPSFIYAKISAPPTGGAEIITGVAGTFCGVYIIGTDDATAKLTVCDSFGDTTTGKLFASDYLGQVPSILIPTIAIGRIGFGSFFGTPITNGITVYAEHQIEAIFMFTPKP